MTRAAPYAKPVTTPGDRARKSRRLRDAATLIAAGLVVIAVGCAVRAFGRGIDAPAWHVAEARR